MPTNTPEARALKAFEVADGKVSKLLPAASLATEKAAKSVAIRDAKVRELEAAIKVRNYAAKHPTLSHLDIELLPEPPEGHHLELTIEQGDDELVPVEQIPGQTAIDDDIEPDGPQYVGPEGDEPELVDADSDDATDDPTELFTPEPLHSGSDELDEDDVDDEIKAALGVDTKAKTRKPTSEETREAELEAERILAEAETAPPAPPVTVYATDVTGDDFNTGAPATGAPVPGQGTQTPPPASGDPFADFDN